MLMALEWDINEAQQAWREDGFEKGMAQGMAQGKAEGMAQGKAEGMTQGKVEVAVNLIRLGISYDQIQAATDLPIVKIEELAAKCKYV